MDIAALSMVSSQTKAVNEASVLIMKKSMDAFTQEGQSMLSVLETCATTISLPHLGNSVDMKI